MAREHNHYFKDVSNLQFIDVYRVLELFNVTDPCIQHAVKKLLVAGGRGAGKDIGKDIKESIDSLQRWQEMREEIAPKLTIDNTIPSQTSVYEEEIKGKHSEHFRAVLEDALVTAAVTRNGSPTQKLEVLKLYAMKGQEQ